MKFIGLQPKQCKHNPHPVGHPLCVKKHETVLFKCAAAESWRRVGSSSVCVCVCVCMCVCVCGESVGVCMCVSFQQSHLSLVSTDCGLGNEAMYKHAPQKNPFKVSTLLIPTSET